MAVLLYFVQTRFVHVRIFRQSFLKAVNDLLNGVANHPVDFHEPSDEFALGDGRRNINLPCFHPGEPGVLRQQPVEQGRSRAEITHDEDRFFDLLAHMLWVKELVQAVGQPDAEMVQGVEQEDHRQNEEAFGGQSAWRSFRFEETDPECFKIEFEIEFHDIYFC